MTLGKLYRQIKNNYEMAKSLYCRWNLAETVDYIRQDYMEVSVEVLEALLDTHPELWEMVNSLE